MHLIKLLIDLENTDISLKNLFLPKWTIPFILKRNSKKFQIPDDHSAKNVTNKIRTNAIYNNE